MVHHQSDQSVLIVFVVGLLVWGIRWRRTGRALMISSGTIFLVIALTPVSLILLRPLEDRFSPAQITGEIHGAIVLGGGLNSELTFARGPIALSQAGARVIEVALLAHRYPEMRIAFSGGSAAMVLDEIPEAETARQLLTGLGIDPNRVIFEGQSRSTSENALRSRALIPPGQKWLLVTSAFHMPRAIGTFRAAGIDVAPYPVAYLTKGNWQDWVDYSLAPVSALDARQIATKEWIGLVAYWATGRTRELFPGR